MFCWNEVLNETDTGFDVIMTVETYWKDITFFHPHYSSGTTYMFHFVFTEVVAVLDESIVICLGFFLKQIGMNSQTTLTNRFDQLRKSIEWRQEGFLS